MSFEIKQASRQGVKPLIGIFAESGCGKTMSSLLLARGIVGPTGRIVLADTESGRGQMFADEIPGGYETISVEPPFSPKRCVELIEFVEKSGADIGIIDSGSHFWEGIGGVLDQAMENEERSKKAGLHNWKTPKMDHAQMVLRLQQSKIPWIICLRAKFKTRQLREPGKPTQIVKDDKTSPIQDENFIFEMTAHLEILPDHTITLTKKGTAALAQCFPADRKEPITVKHGEAIARWANNGAATPAPEKPKMDPEAEAILRDIFEETKQEHSGDRKAFRALLVSNRLIEPSDKLNELTAERLNKILSAIRDLKAAQE